ncbi:lipoate--protein ligase family protein [Simkania negevensis]|uniref:Lipoate--protein ligase family protein n=1 Tax=Simkania negevensis TaxID=83561 RepID=A0ABS3APU3_9BACT|nr:lipoate--protein ligase family protein [Simkania negevensis]
MNKHPLTLILLDDLFIFDQLRLEEALLRADDGNYCIINTGSADAIVMGISGKPERLVDTRLVAQRKVPIIKRFSGGGTVYIDSNTLFVTFIGKKNIIGNKNCFPESIMRWSYDLYRPVFNHSQFQLKENDFTFGQLKFGGNAQYIRKERWLHHTSFLWDYDPAKMACLLLPEKQPDYRARRPHSDFLCSLNSYFKKKDNFFDKLTTELAQRFDLRYVERREVDHIITRPHRMATKLL